MADGIFTTGLSSSSGFGLNLGLQQSQNQAQNQASNSAYNTAQSNSYIPEYSQTPILQSIAQEAQGMAPQVYQWGLDAYNRNQGNIDNLMRAGQMWASPQHIAAQMGQAEAGVQQAGEQARQSALQDLQSYGIDPSAGRYAALDQANRVQTAAAAAGAGNQQRQADIAQGLTMQNQAMSAGLQNTQIGYGAANAMNSLLGTGMQLKYSPLGTTSTSTGTSSGASSGYSSGSSLGQTFGEQQQQSQSAQYQPSYSITQQGAYSTAAFRGGYIGRDHVEHPKGDEEGYALGGAVRAGMNVAPRMAAPAMAPRFNTAPDYGGITRSILQRAQSGIASTPSDVAARAEPMLQQTEGVIPNLMQHYGVRGYQSGGDVIGGDDRDGGEDGGDGSTAMSSDDQSIGARLERQSAEIGYGAPLPRPQSQSTKKQKPLLDQSIGARLDRQGADIGYGGDGPVQGYRRGGRVRIHPPSLDPSGMVDVGGDLARQSERMGQTLAMQGVPRGTIGGPPNVDVGAGRIDPMTGQQNMPSSGPGADYIGPGQTDPMTGQQTYGYAGGGVVGTTTSGFNPSGPVGGAPIGSPTLTSGVAGGMARGGPVDPTTGGFVSQALSPSDGQQVDDVPARLNEGEYVIPRDVVQFKGKEFFHKLIAQSRKNREAHQQSFFGGGGVQSYGQTA